MPVVLGDLGLEAIVSHAEHLAREGVGHDRLARLAGHLGHNASAADSTLPAVAHGVRGFGLLAHDLRECVRGHRVLQVHRPIVDVRRVRLLSIAASTTAHRLLVIQTSGALEGSGILMLGHVGAAERPILLLAGVERLVHVGEVRLDAHGWLGAAVHLSALAMDLGGRVTLRNARVVAGLLRAAQALLPVQLIQVRPDRICVESLQGHFVVHG